MKQTCKKSCKSACQLTDLQGFNLNHIFINTHHYRTCYTKEKYKAVMDKIHLKLRFNEQGYKAVCGRIEKESCSSVPQLQKTAQYGLCTWPTAWPSEARLQRPAGCTCAAATPHHHTHNWQTAACLQQRRDKISKETAGLLVRRVRHQPT